MAKLIFILACAAACFAPMVFSKSTGVVTLDKEFRGFALEFEGRPLRDVGLTQREQYFLTDFPGQIGRFTDGKREIIIRRVTEATRKLHPAADCFRAIGYSITPLPLRVDADGRRWSSFVAVKGDESLNVYERIEDNAGLEWTDVSAWYWSVWGQEKGEWWAWTIAERK